MRTILLVLCILSVTFSAKAQLFGRDWSEGSYYDLSGKKITGLISWSVPSKSIFSGPGDNIFFKPNKEGKKVKIPSTQLTAFVMENDSFVISHHQDLAKAPFLAVMLNSAVKLYLSSTARASAPMMVGNPAMMGTAMMYTAGFAFSGNKNVYYYGSDADALTKLEKKQFIEVMSKIMADKPEVVAKIQDKTFKYSKIEKLLDYYKTGKLSGKDTSKTDDAY
jgi:hypothetical protein